MKTITSFPLIASGVSNAQPDVNERNRAIGLRVALSLLTLPRPRFPELT